ncbi:MAG: hypothetical protein WDO70_04190 [Alphaproteobacteria bacterium]
MSYIDHYWSGADRAALEESIAACGTECSVLGVREGGVAELDEEGSPTGAVYGDAGIFYAAIRSPCALPLPQECQPADAYMCVKLFGVWE